MNIQQETEALEKLPPQKYTIRILVIAVCSLFGLLLGVWNYMKEDVIDLKEQLVKCNVEKQNMSDRWRIEGKQEDQERIRKAEEDKRKADSILMIVVMTKSNIKKAIQNEKRKK